MRGRFAFAAGVALAASVAAHAGAVARPPYAIVRALQAAQDELAADAAARAAQQGALFREFSDTAGRDDTTVWLAARNRRALAAYLLRGGTAAPAWAKAADLATPDERPLLLGAIALAEGRNMEALKLLAGVDPRTAPPEIGAILAFVLARLNRSKQEKEAVRYLSLVCLLAPGTLLEEAALRQQIFIVSDTADIDRFISLSRRYMLRYSNSNYFANFQSRFETSFVHAWMGADDSRRSALELALSSLTSDQRTTMYLALAREALLAGDIGGCHAAVQRVRAIGAAKGAATARAALYEAISDIFSLHRDAAVQALGGMDARALDQVDEALRQSALALAASIGRVEPASPGSVVGDDNAVAALVGARLRAADAFLDSAR